MENNKTIETTALMDSNTIMEKKAPVIRKKIGNTTFLVKVHFNEASKENMQDKISRMLREDVRYMES